LAKWSTKLKDSLPDSAFLVVVPGGKKDKDGKTVPRSLRHLPVYGPDGEIDINHLHSALTKIDSTDIPKKYKRIAHRKAEALLSEYKKSHGDDEMKKSFRKSLSDGMSYQDLRQELSSIVQQKYGRKSKDGNYYVDYPWVVDVYEDELVVERNGKYYIADYTVDGNNVTIDEFYPARKKYSKVGNKPVKTLEKSRNSGSMIDEVDRG
jgi:hypothetical protein